MSRMTEYQSDLAPAFHADPQYQALYGGLADVKDELLENSLEALMTWFIQKAPEDALAYHARERLLERYPGETLEAFRTRILEARSIWEIAGTDAGVILALSQLGYFAQVGQVRVYDSARWSEFDVYIYPSSRTYDGTTAEKNRILGVINKFKSAQSKLNKLVYTPTNGLTWNNAGTWNPTGIKWGGAPQQLYP